MLAPQNMTVSAKAESDERPFLFVGNGPYRNRGCEAIVRGTMKILSEVWGPDICARAGVMAAPETIAEQQAGEIDPRLTNFSVSLLGKRLSRKWWLAQANRRLGTRFHHHTLDLKGPAKGVRAALQLGGDNFSLDYGNLHQYVAINTYLQQHGVPVFIWGASVGPFEKEPETAQFMYNHLKTVDGIFVRETATRDYLARNGVSDNVHLVADPAFVMEKTAPKGDVQSLVTDQTVGINISPLVARFAGAEGLDAWREKAVAMIIACGQRVGLPILLIPHVGSPKPGSDDFSFLQSVKEAVGDRASVPVNILPPLSATELKWVIGRCAAFAGARTHSTIAALSSQVPTLSLSYSVKAVGINQDIFGHQEFCHSVKTIEPEQFAEIMARLIDENAAIRAALDKTIPEIRHRAQSAGWLLKDLIGG